MLIVIDESGDPGFKLTKGSTRYFVVAMVIFRDFGQAEATSRAIRDLREKLGIKPEFKFNKTEKRHRDSFFEAVRPFEFSVRALVVDKNNIYSPHLRDETDRFYNFFVNRLLHHDNGVLTNARVKIDGSGDRRFKQELGSYMRRQLGGGKVRSIKFVDSRRDDLVQLADMVVGAVARSYKEDVRTDHRRWLDMLGSKIEDVWDFK